MSVQVLLALMLGLGVGAAATAYGGPALKSGITAVEALGALWLNALRMTVVPLIFAVLVNGIAQVSDAAATGRLAFRALAWFAGLLMVSALIALAVSGGQPVANRTGQVEELLQRHSAAPANVRPQALARDVFHRDIADAIFGSGIVNGDDVGMIA